MIAIVMTYYDRLPQLQRTVKSLNWYKRKDFVVIIVDDKSPEPIPKLDNKFPIDILRIEERSWASSCIAYNKGFHKALEYDPKFIIIQNAECVHKGDVLGYAQKNLTAKNYIAFGCYSLGKDDTCPPAVMNERKNNFDGDSAWYNHPVYRPSGYHFCSAITTRNLVKINGFDERFKDGAPYDDDYFVHQIRTLGLRIDIPVSPFVFHQYHYSKPRDMGQADNKTLYENLKSENQYRGLHLITPDL